MGVVGEIVSLSGAAALTPIKQVSNVRTISEVISEVHVGQELFSEIGC